MKLQKIIIPILAILLVVTIVTAIKASSEGNTLVFLENKAADLEVQNRELKDKIVSSSSLTKIGENATSLGMSQPEKFIYMTREGLALR